MSQTNTKQYQDVSRGKPRHRGSHGNNCDNRNGNCGNSPFANSSLVEKITNNRISSLSITKDRPRSIQLKKILKAISAICQDEHYDYILDIISTDTKPTQEYFLSNHLIKRKPSFKHHVKVGFVDPIIGLDVPSGNSLIDSEIVENTTNFNSSPQEQYHFDYDHELNATSQVWDELIANKKSVENIILDQCNEDTRAEIAL